MEPALSPGSRTHSCSAVYFRSSGYNAAPRLVLGRRSSDGAGMNLLAPGRLGVLRLGRLAQGGDLDVLALLDGDLALVERDVVDEATGEPQCRGERLRVTDDVDGERRLEHAAVHVGPARGRLERGLRHDPRRVVDLDRLGAGVAQLLDAV